MILRRLSQSLKEQNWTAIWIEFILLVGGVFLGIQVSNWNTERVDSNRAQGYLERIRDDINVDIASYRDRKSFWSDVSDYGVKGLNYAESGNANGASQWELLLAYFQASQVAEVYMNNATFEELKSAGEVGLITDTEIRSELTRYYLRVFNPLLTERPRYREHVRGIIPLDVQKYVWNHCYSSDSDGIQKLLPCKSPLDEKRATEIVDAIRHDKDLMAELRYWMSNMHVASIFLEGSIESAIKLRDAINEKLGRSSETGAP